MTKDEILQKHEDQNEYHFHQVDRKWIMEAMQEYADQQLQLHIISQQRELLLAYENYKDKYSLIGLENEEWKIDKFLNQ